MNTQPNMTSLTANREASGEAPGSSPKQASEDATRKKINLIYIASIGRSGTTLLDSMLGAHSHIATVGEFEIWPHEIRQGGVRPCSCGEHVHDCPFWTAVRARIDPMTQPEPRLDAFREKHNAGKTLRPERLADFRPEPLAADVAPLVRQYAENNYTLYQAILDVTEEQTGTRPSWIADSSKDVYRMLWLMRSGLFNIKVLHMVKDPHGFVYSVTKQWLDSADPLRHQKRLYYSARQSLAWVVRNRLFSRVARHHLSPKDYLLIRYEDLASAPHATFQTVCDRIGIPYEEAAVDNFREGSQHTIAGNPMRYETRGIQLDERWKTRLPASSRRVTELITTGTRGQYGYS